MTNINAQFGRTVRLIVSSEQPIADQGSAPAAQPAPTNQGLDISGFRFTFNVYNADVESPNTAIVKVYNLSDTTRKRIINEFNTITLSAGYQNKDAVIFRGNIKQNKTGRERNIDGMLEIRAADGDAQYNFGLFNNGQGTSLKSGWTSQQVIDEINKTSGLKIDPNANNTLGGIVAPRGKVLFGLWRSTASNLAATQSARFSIQNGVVTFIPLTGYLPGQAVEINSQTGMIGVPEATDNGIEVVTLLNPLIKIGTQIHINQQDITQTIVKQQWGFPAYTSVGPFIADATQTGFYRVLVAEHSGDTRGNEFYTKITALSLDTTAPAGNAVKAYG